MPDFRYTESGLDNVIVWGGNFSPSKSCQVKAKIPNIDGLHRAIAMAIVAKPCAMTGKELRFLRTEMGMSESRLATIIHRDPLAVTRWEAGEGEQIDANAEALVRLHVREVLSLPVEDRIKNAAGWHASFEELPTLHIDGSNPDHYKPLQKPPTKESRRKPALSMLLRKGRLAARARGVKG